MQGGDGAQFLQDSAFHLTQPLPGTLRYQLFHRTAAAVIEAQNHNADAAAMIVQSFSQTDRWFGDFAAFCTLFGITAKRDTAHLVHLPNGKPLILGWAKGDRRFLADLTA